jgi:hypothetical protein
MSNLSQFFALGGNKIKSIQTVVFIQTGGRNDSLDWNGVSATISSVDLSKTIVLPSPASGWNFLTGGVAYTVDGHGAYLSNSTTVVPYGPYIRESGFGLTSSGPITMAVQIIEFE